MISISLSNTTNWTGRRAGIATTAALLLTTSAVTVATPGIAQAFGLPRASAAKPADSAVMRAISEGSAEQLVAAIAAGEDVNRGDKGGKTPLMLAASLGRTDLVQTLLEHGAQVNQCDNDGRTALHYVLAAAHPEPAKKKRGFGGLLDQAKGVGGKALEVVASAGSLSAFLPGGPLLMNLAQGMMGKGMPGLMVPGAAFGLGSQGAWSGVLGAALVHGGAAGKAGAAPILGALDGVLQKGAPPAAAASSWNVLLSSAGSTQPDLYRAMSNLGPDATPAERAAWSQFLQAAQSGDEASLQAMLTNPTLAPVLARATTGLEAAANQIPGRDGGAGIVNALVAHGADTTLMDKSGVTALQRAQSLKLDAVIGVLQQPVRSAAR